MTMRQVSAILVLLSLSLQSCKDNADAESEYFKRYPIKSAHIKYVITGDGDGVENLYFDDYGRYELIKSDFIAGISKEPKPVNQTMLTRLSEVYTMPNDTTSTPRRMKIMSLDSLYSLKNDIPPYSAIVNKTLEDGKFQLEGTEPVAGVLTERWRQVLGNTTIFLYRGVVLKRIFDSQNGAVFVQAAVEFDTTWKPTKGFFDVPVGITFDTSAPKPKTPPGLPPGLPPGMPPPRR